MRATVTVSLRRDDGVLISREFSIESSRSGYTYKGESKASFVKRLRKQTISALNAVTGVSPLVDVEKA